VSEGPVASVGTPATPTELPAETSTPAIATPELPTGSVGGPGDYTPGEVRYRVVNLYKADGQEQAVDVYVRTQGLVDAFMISAGLGYGEATDYFAPPDPGVVIAMAAGAPDPLCVGDCPQFLTASPTSFGEGDPRTIILYPDGTLQLWHNPDPASVGQSGNALEPADPSTALLYVVGVALEEAQFGLHLAFEGEPGCQTNLQSASIMVGGNQVARFGFDGQVGVNLHDSLDMDCTEDAVGGPFEVSGDAGSRTLLVLYGQPGTMRALVLDL
jgi:hypothetical protein